MTEAEQIRKTEEFLRRKLNGGAYMYAHPEDKAYRLAHSFRVANIGRQIARREGFDVTEMTIACLLHDVSYCETFGENGWEEHGRRSAAIARPFLTELGLAPERIADICFGIAIHVDDRADFPGERTPFALTVGDADNIDRFDALRLHETLCRVGFLALPEEEKLTMCLSRRKRLEELLTMEMATGSAAALWSERLAFGMTFFDKLIAQLRSSGAIED